MSFTDQELCDTAKELTSEIGRLLSKKTKPDVLLGNHPVVVVASQKQSIAIWHGKRIEKHLGDWIRRIPGWNAKVGETITFASAVHEIDTLAWNSTIGIVLAVEAKRVWANQDKGSDSYERQKNALYSASKHIITSHIGQPTCDFRYFVFDVFGTTKKGKNGLPIIAGDKIENIFGSWVWNYISWERQVMRNEILKSLDQNSQEYALEELLKGKVLNEPPSSSVGKHDILKYIDDHAR